MLRLLVFLIFALLLAQGSFAATAKIADKSVVKKAKTKTTSTTTSATPAAVNSVTSLPTELKTPEYKNSIQIGSVYKALVASTEGAGHDHDVVLQPNNPMGVSLGWSNRPLGISLVGNIANGARNNERVSTSAEDYQLRYFSSKIGLEFIYQKYQGFTQSSGAGEFVTENESRQGNLAMTMLQVQFDWAFHGEGALESFGANWQKPTRDGAAYYFTSSISQAEISNPTPFLPQAASADYGNDATLTQGKYQTLAAGLGASYVWQWTRFYTAIFGSIQGGPQKQTYQTTTTAWDNLKYVWFPQAKLVLGYDWGSWYVNLIGHTHRVTVDLKDTDLAFFSQDAGIYVGSRF